MTAKVNAPTAGVYYCYHDYAGFLRRVLVDIIDVLVMLIVWFFAAGGLLSGSSACQRQPQAVSEGVFLAVSFLYMVLLKRSSLRTLGYRLCRVRLVNLQGAPAGLVPLALRYLMLFIGPLNYLIDLIWLSGDPARQAFRDKLTRTYVIRANAIPQGEGIVGYQYYDIAGMTWLFPEVRITPGPSG